MEGDRGGINSLRAMMTACVGGAVWVGVSGNFPEEKGALSTTLSHQWLVPSLTAPRLSRPEIPGTVMELGLRGIRVMNKTP